MYNVSNVKILVQIVSIYERNSTDTKILRPLSVLKLGLEPR